VETYIHKIWYSSIYVWEMHFWDDRSKLYVYLICWISNHWVFRCIDRSATNTKTAKWRNRTSSSSGCLVSCASMPPLLYQRHLVSDGSTAATHMALSTVGRGWHVSQTCSHGLTSQQRYSSTSSRWQVTHSWRHMDNSSTNSSRWSLLSLCRSCTRCRQQAQVDLSPDWRASWRSASSYATFNHHRDFCLHSSGRHDTLNSHPSFLSSSFSHHRKGFSAKHKIAMLFVFRKTHLSISLSEWELWHTSIQNQRES